jgi:hypothetical protein
VPSPSPGTPTAPRTLEDQSSDKALFAFILPNWWQQVPPLPIPPPVLQQMV